VRDQTGEKEDEDSTTAGSASGGYETSSGSSAETESASQYEYVVQARRSNQKQQPRLQTRRLELLKPTTVVCQVLIGASGQPVSSKSQCIYCMDW
jgi:hypothetical protein